MTPFRLLVIAVVLFSVGVGLRYGLAAGYLFCGVGLGILALLAAASE